MIKVMLVDDEPIFLRGFQSLIDWAQTGCQVTQLAESGEDALLKLEQNQPDILITDLVMPGMNGIELIRCVKHLHPSIEIIILSGHGEFEFAQQAMENEVSGYLLKPVSRRQMTQEVRKAAEKIEKHRSSHAEMERRRVQLAESMPLLKDRFLRELIHNGISDEAEHARKRTLLGLDLNGIAFFIALVQAPWRRDRAVDESGLILDLSLSDFCSELLNSQQKAYLTMDADLLCLLVISEHDGFSDLQAYELMNAMWTQIGGKFNVNVTIGMGACCSSLSMLPVSYEGAVNALKSAFFIGDEQVIHVSNTLTIGHSAGVYPEDAEARVLERIKYGGGSPEILADELADAFIAAAGADVATIYEYCHLFHIQLTRMLNALKISGSSPKVSWPFSQRGKQLHNAHSLRELKSWLTSSIADVAQTIAWLHTNKINGVVERAMQYCAEHLSQDLSLGTVAGSLYVNPNYFSQLFKTHTGTNYFDYITRLRMEKARDLLFSKSLKVYEVAEKVGYRNVRSFGEAYKRYFGTTPTEWDKTITEME